MFHLHSRIFHLECQWIIITLIFYLYMVYVSCLVSPFTSNIVSSSSSIRASMARNFADLVVPLAFLDGARVSCLMYVIPVPASDTAAKVTSCFRSSSSSSPSPRKVSMNALVGSLSRAGISFGSSPPVCRNRKRNYMHG
jgi:hypothetical protein